MLFVGFLRLICINSLPLFCLFTSSVLFCLSLFFFSIFDRNYGSYQFVYLMPIGEKKLNSVIYCLALGLDGLALTLIMLTTLLFILIFIGSIKYNLSLVNLYCYCFLSLQGLLILSFLVLDMLSFFFLFESILIPMFLIVGIWGSLNRKIYASLLFFIMTFAGSLALVFSLLTIYSELGSFSFTILSRWECNLNKELLLWYLIFISFLVKVPSIPFHIWLPEAHVEAPTGGSVILAGVLLKLGGYGMLRIIIPGFPQGSVFFSPFISVIGLLSIIYASIIIFRLLDIKKIIAYSSIAHMNLMLLGLFSTTLEGIMGSCFLMIGHGLVSGLLFFLIGFLYDRYHTRYLPYYGGLINMLPLYTFVFLLATLGNIGFPGTCNFIGELFIFFSLIGKNFFVFLVALVTSVILSGMYSLYLYGRLFAGNLTIFSFIHKDLIELEIAIVIPLVILIFWLGIMPSILLDILESYCSLLIERGK